MTNRKRSRRLPPPPPPRYIRPLIWTLRTPWHWVPAGIVIGVLLGVTTGCASTPTLKVSEQVVANCPELSGEVPKDMGATALMLIDTSTQYNKCRAATLGKVPK